MKLFFVIIAIALFSFQTNAQKPNSFLVYSVKGSVTITENNKGIKAQIGNLLTEQSKITVGKNSLVSIICNESSLFSITKAGTYSMTQFKDSCLTNKSSITSSYLKFIWNQLTTHNGTPEKNRKNYMNNVGAVSRTNNSVWIDSRLDTINFHQGNFPLSWKCFSDATAFSVEILQLARGGEPLVKKTVTKTSISINELTPELNNNSTYYWKVVAKGEESDERKVLVLWDSVSYNILLTELKNTQTEFESEAEESFRLGFLLESARFYAEAYEYYKKAVQLNAEIELYQKTLAAFRKDYNIEE
jgi:tetratricopeptide (TPR) repeat protein